LICRGGFGGGGAALCFVIAGADDVASLKSERERERETESERWRRGRA